MRINKSLIAYTPTSGAGSGSVTSVALTAPTGFTVSGSPITTSGTLSLAFTTGYGIPPLMTGNSGKFLTTNGTTMSWANIAGTDVTGAAISTSNDTNILITASGNTTNALLRTLTLTTGWTGQLAVGRGGTGASTLTGVIIGNGTSAMTALASTNPQQLLRVNTLGTAYEWFTPQFLVPTDIIASSPLVWNAATKTMSVGTITTLGTITTGVWQATPISPSYGGTGATSITGVVIGNGIGTMTGVAGTANQLLRRDATNSFYEFFTPTFLTNPMTSLGDIIYGNAAGAPLRLAANSTGTNMYLRSVSGGAPSWQQIQPSDIAGGAATGSGTTNYVAKWTSSTALGNSQIIDNGVNVGIGLTASWKLQVAPLNAYTALNTGDGFVVYNPSLSSVNLFLGVNGSGTSQGALIQGRSGTASTFAIQLQPYGGNVGIGINPSYSLDVNGNIGISGNKFAGQSGSYHVISDQLNVTCITIGGTDPTNAYDNTSHLFRSRNGSSQYASIGTSGVQTSNHFLLPSANYITWGGVYGANIPSITGTSGTGAFLSFHPSGSSSGEKMRLSDSGQLRLHGYTSTTSFAGLLQGFLGFTSTGAIVTAAVPGGVSGTQNYLAKFDSTGAAVGNSRIVDDGANFLFNGASSVVTGLNLVGSISATDSGGGVTILRRSAIPAASDSLGIIDAWGITTGSTYVWGGGIEIRASQAWNSTSAGTEIAIATTPDNTTSATDMFVFLNNGAVRFIGRTSNPLSPVAGTMYYNSSANNMRYYNGTSWITF